MAKKPSHDFDAAAALGILWVVAMPASAQANTPFDVMLHAHEFAGLLPKLLGGIYHTDQGSRLEYATQVRR